jgi:excisionase family DNA binding protein
MVKYYTPKEVARELRVTERTVYEWLTTGRLRGMRAGTRWRIRPEELEAFMQTKHGGTTVSPKGAQAIGAEEHARRVDALMGKYAHAAFSTEDLFRERREERAREERSGEPPAP